MSNKAIAKLEVFCFAIVALKFIGSVITGTMSASIIAAGTLLLVVVAVMIYKDIKDCFKKD